MAWNCFVLISESEACSRGVDGRIRWIRLPASTRVPPPVSRRHDSPERAEEPPQLQELQMVHERSGLGSAQTLPTGGASCSCMGRGTIRLNTLTSSWKARTRSKLFNLWVSYAVHSEERKGEIMREISQQKVCQIGNRDIMTDKLPLTSWQLEFTWSVLFFSDSRLLKLMFERMDAVSLNYL